MIRIATGSATVATITGAGIVVPVVGMVPGVNLELLVLATGAGSLVARQRCRFLAGEAVLQHDRGRDVQDLTAMETILTIVALGFIMLLSLVV